MISDLSPIQSLPDELLEKIFIDIISEQNSFHDVKAEMIHIRAMALLRVCKRWAQIIKSSRIASLLDKAIFWGHFNRSATATTLDLTQSFLPYEFGDLYPSLTTLNLVKVWAQWETIWKGLFQLCNLRHLNITVGAISEPQAKNIGPSSHTLQTLKLSFHSGGKESLNEWLYLFSSCTQLRALSIQSDTLLNYPGSYHAMTQLRQIELSNLSKFYPSNIYATFPEWCTKLQHLGSLKIIYPHINFIFPTAFEQLTHLKKLTYVGCSEFQNIYLPTSLTHLKLNVNQLPKFTYFADNCYHVKYEQSQQNQHFLCPFTFPRGSQLKKCKIKAFNRLPGINIVVSNSFKYLNSLEMLSFEGFNNDQLPEVFHLLTNLRHLKIVNCPQITNLQSITQWTQLKELSVELEEMKERPLKQQKINEGYWIHGTKRLFF